MHFLKVFCSIRCPTIHFHLCIDHTESKGNQGKTSLWDLNSIHLFCRKWFPTVSETTAGKHFSPENCSDWLNRAERIVHWGVLCLIMIVVCELEPVILTATITSTPSECICLLGPLPFCSAADLPGKGYLKRWEEEQKIKLKCVIVPDVLKPIRDFFFFPLVCRWCGRTN